VLPPTTNPPGDKSGSHIYQLVLERMELLLSNSLPTSLNPLPTAKGRNVPPPTMTTMVPVSQRKPTVNLLGDMEEIGEASEGSWKISRDLPSTEWLVQMHFFMYSLLINPYFKFAISPI